MKQILLLATILVLLISCTKDKGSIYSPEVLDLLSQMTLEEKIGQMNQYNGFWEVTGPPPSSGDDATKYENLKKGLVGSMLNVHGVENVRKVQELVVNQSRLGIPLIIGFDVVHGYRTMSPIPLAEAASWDLEAIEHSARIAAEEASASGVAWTFAPMVDISRDARWGRVMEGGGEDPYLGAKIAAARVKGFQGDDLSAENTIAACAKHFAAYGFAEGGRDYNTVDISHATLYNHVFPPFQAAVDAGVSTIMNSFNELNGTPATASSFLQRDILKGLWGFEGFVVSDWASIEEIVDHRNATSRREAASIAIKAGSDMDMASSTYLNNLKNLVESGEVPERLIDDAVCRILQVKHDLGLLEDPFRYLDEDREKNIVGCEAHQEAVLDMAQKSVVLLKNEQELLPLPKEGKTIALIGPLADDKNSPLGNWRGRAIDSSAVSVLEGLNAYPGNHVLYAKGCEYLLEEGDYIAHPVINIDDRSGFGKAVDAAEKADVVVMVLGEGANQSGEARSRSSLGLLGVQQELLEAVYQVNPNIVLVLMSGRPMAITWADENIPAILEAWLLGSQSGHAIAQVLHGDYNPSGKLPMTFPRTVGQVPLFYNHKISARPWDPEADNVYLGGYVDGSVYPLYPFGHGLSYTHFEYDNLQVEKTGDQEFSVSIQLGNTGNYDGEEVVQLYICDRVASETRPVKELKGFKKVKLRKGEECSIQFKLGEKELGYYLNSGQFIVEPGTFDLWVGTSSMEGLHTQFEIK